ncbi:MAG: glutamate racemase [candidate division Zixibacteria bacterium]|nr:glutamate racemase [candidate division Zixibacteria bacterium]
MKIGIFDSGIGGLTVAARIFEVLPQADVIYFGDTARYPYGPRSSEVVQKLSCQNTRFLLSKKVDFIVVACNTASAFALDNLKKKFNTPMLGVIEPGAKAAVRHTKNKRVGVIGTVGTITSKSYPKAIRRLDKSIKVFTRACPLLVALAEEGYINKKATNMIVQEYLKPLIRKGIDTLILGCTHYPLLKRVIARVMGNRVKLIDSAEEIAFELKRYLKAKSITARSNERGTRTFFVSDVPEKFVQIGERFLGKKTGQVQRIDIDRY